MITLTKMINPIRRQEIKNTVLSALNHASVASLPVNIKAICKSYINIRLIPFSLQMKKRNLTYKEMVDYCETSDACADYYQKFGCYIIYYNDIDKTKLIYSNRYRWSIAHELGHILLNHHKTACKIRLVRQSLSRAEYNYFEKEADYFAQLLLVPHAALYALNVKNAFLIKHLCQISEPAAHKRFREYNEWMRNISKSNKYDRSIYYFYRDFIWKRHCKTCDAHLIQPKGKYCMICGQKTLEWGEGKMKYPKLDVYEGEFNGKLKVCPICNNEETNIDGEYCQICGTCLVNYCSNIACRKPVILPSNARYCPECGKESEFFISGILKKWNVSEETSEDEVLPFFN